MGRYRNWCFTVFSLDGLPMPHGTWNVPSSKYLIYQLEKAPETGRLHYQGFVMFAQPKSLSQVKAVLAPGSHCDNCKGTPKQNIEYCSKPDSRVEGPFSFGEAPAGQGNRSDLESVQVLLDSGTTMAEIARDHFAVYIRHHRAFNAYVFLMAKNRFIISRLRPFSLFFLIVFLTFIFSDTQTTLEVFWGPSGSGKSRRAHADYPNAFWLVKPSSTGGTLWWDGYDGQAVVVIDEFYGWISRDLVQRLVDRYPLQVQTKGGSVKFNSPKIVITSNVPPSRFWKSMGVDGMAAFNRRLNDPSISNVTFVGHDGGLTEEQYVDSLPIVVPQGVQYHPAQVPNQFVPGVAAAPGFMPGEGQGPEN